MSTDTAVMPRPPASEILVRNPVVAVLRARHADQYAPVISALAEGGVRSIELTLSTAGVFDLLPRLAGEFGADVEVGVGTITTTAEAERALDCGARFLVTPVTETCIVQAAVARGIPVFPGLGDAFQGRGLRALTARAARVSSVVAEALDARGLG